MPPLVVERRRVQVGVAHGSAGSGYFFTANVFGSTRTIAFWPPSVIQGAPSGPTITPCGAEPAPSAISLTSPVFGSSQPSSPRPCAVYQTPPSARRRHVVRMRARRHLVHLDVQRARRERDGAAVAARLRPRTTSRTRLAWPRRGRRRAVRARGRRSRRRRHDPRRLPRTAERRQRTHAGQGAASRSNRGPAASGSLQVLRDVRPSTGRPLAARRAAALVASFCEGGSVAGSRLMTSRSEVRPGHPGFGPERARVDSCGALLHEAPPCAGLLDSRVPRLVRAATAPLCIE